MTTCVRPSPRRLRDPHKLRAPLTASSAAALSLHHKTGSLKSIVFRRGTVVIKKHKRPGSNSSLESGYLDSPASTSSAPTLVSASSSASSREGKTGETPCLPSFMSASDSTIECVSASASIDSGFSFAAALCVGAELRSSESGELLLSGFGTQRSVSLTADSARGDAELRDAELMESSFNQMRDEPPHAHELELAARQLDSADDCEDILGLSPNERESIVQFLFHAAGNFDISRNAVGCAVRLFDRFMLRGEYPANWRSERLHKWTALTCLLLSAKFNDTRSPPISQLLAFMATQPPPERTHLSRTAAQAPTWPMDPTQLILDLELVVLSALEWEVGTRTPYSYLSQLIALYGLDMYCARHRLAEFLVRIQLFLVASDCASHDQIPTPPAPCLLLATPSCADQSPWALAHSGGHFVPPVSDARCASSACGRSRALRRTPSWKPPAALQGVYRSSLPQMQARPGAPSSC